MQLVKNILRKANLSLSGLTLLVLIFAPISAYANCERTIYNKSNVTYVVKCKGCETPWQKTIPPGGSASIEYTGGWHYATLQFISAGEANRYRNPSTFGVWRHKNGTTQEYLLAEYGYRKNHLEISVGKQTHIGGCHNFYFASYANSSNAFRAYNKRHINAPWGSTGYLSLNNPAKMDIKIYASGERSSCYYLKVLLPAALRGKQEKFICRCVDTKELKKYTPADADGPCEQPGKLFFRSGKAYTPPRSVHNPSAPNLTQKLAGTNWSYTLGPHIVKFRFGRNGAIEGHAPWSRVRWQASSNKAVLLSASTGARMTLDFSDQKNFRARNWGSKDIAVGTRIAWLTPPKHVLFKRALAGTFWSLTAGNYHNNFKFGNNGKLQHGSWNNRVKWRVSGDNIVTLYGVNNATMKLYFNGEKSFSTRGWNDLGWNRKTMSTRNNQVATGRRLDRRLETPKVNNRLRQPGCTTLASARSTGGGRKVTATFVNAAGTRLMAFWIDFSGKQKFYKSIEPNARFTINTSTKHPWILRTIDNACRAIIMPNEQSPQVTIE